MKQKRQISLMESVVNTVSGFVLNFILQIILFWLLGIKVKIEQNILIMLVFTVTSIGRNYIVRRIFNR